MKQLIKAKRLGATILTGHDSCVQKSYVIVSLESGKELEVKSWSSVSDLLINVFLHKGIAQARQFCSKIKKQYPNYTCDIEAIEYD